jgi:hypothetical protein
MAADEDHPSPIALLALALNPLLIMMMVGSLVWFLVDVFYQGQYSERLLWSLSFFIAGAVLIARISIELGQVRATLYAAGLGAVIFLAMLRFVDYPNSTLAAIGPLLNLGLLGLIWWLTHKLTWDCTFLHEDQQVSGRGLLSAVGFDGTAQTEAEMAALRKAARRKKSDPPGLVGWWARFQRIREARRRRPHTPGTWILYFALIAMPVFMFGQMLIPTTDESRRFTTLVEMAVFVGSGLGLLMTTSLLGLREYLRERKARLPLTPVIAWLGLGAGLIVIGLGLAAMMPRPHQEWNWWPEPTKASSQKRESSRYALREPGESGRKTDSNRDFKSATTAEKPGQAGREEKKSEPLPEESSGKPSDSTTTAGTQKPEPGFSPGHHSHKNPRAAGSEQKEQPESGKNSGTVPKSEQRSSPGAAAGSPSASMPSSHRAGGSTTSSAKTSENSRDSSNDSRGAGDSDRSRGVTTAIHTTLETVSKMLTWFVWIIIVVILLGGLFYALLHWLAPFSEWAWTFLAWFRFLSSRDQTEKREERSTEDSEEERSRRLPPFSSFSNPFTDGTVRRRNPRDLVIYTFTALDSWAAERGWDRHSGETPGEFVARLGEAVPALRDSSKQLAPLLARAMYSPSALPPDIGQTLAEFWQILESHSLVRTEPPS